MREIKMSDKYYCNRLRVLKYLLDNGAKVESQVPDINYPNRTVWIFNSKDVVDLLNEYNKEFNHDFKYVL